MSSLFNDLIGQSLAVAFLEASLRKKHFAPAYLFCGPNGVGRKLAAFRFLEGLLFNGKSSESLRRRLEEKNHPDLLIIEPTYIHQGRLVPKSEADLESVSSRTPPQIRLEQIRDLKRFLGRNPVEAKHGMVIIESVDLMAEPAANALLKTLEEPGHGLLILISSAPDRLLSTIRSRCQNILFKRLDMDQLKFVLKKKRILEFESLSKNESYLEILSLANGSPGQLIQNLHIWKSIPDDISNNLKNLPQNPLQALSLARDLTDTLDGEQQLWLINWLQFHLWNQKLDQEPLRRLEKLRLHLLGYVQPRLAWEVALLDLMVNS